MAKLTIGKTSMKHQTSSMTSFWKRSAKYGQKNHHISCTTTMLILGLTQLMDLRARKLRALPTECNF
jgi:hypothetical protein